MMTLFAFVLLACLVAASAAKERHGYSTVRNLNMRMKEKKDKKSPKKGTKKGAEKGESSGSAGGDASTKIRLSVMTYNIYGGGGNEGKPVNETVAAMLAAGADIIGVQETRLEGAICVSDFCPASGPSVASRIADDLGFYYYDQTAINDLLWANAVISRYPIIGNTTNDLGVAIQVDQALVYIFNVHFTDFPYQPYQLLNIPYGPAPYLNTSAEAVAAADSARGAALDLLMQEIEDWALDADAIFITGDFNEPNHLDWTNATVAAGLQPLVVQWPTTYRIAEDNFTDVLRAVYPDPVAVPAFTWTPTTLQNDTSDHHDRIDQLFVRAKTGLLVVNASVVGEKYPEAEIVVDPWPSDHRAVVGTVEFSL